MTPDVQMYFSYIKGKIFSNHKNKNKFLCLIEKEVIDHKIKDIKKRM